MGRNLHGPQSYSSLPPLVLTIYLANNPTTRKNIFLWRLKCVTVCPIVYTLCLHFFDCKYYWLVVWYEASGFYSINTITLLGLLLDILLLPCVMEILKLWFCRTAPSHTSVVHRWGRYWGWQTQNLGPGPGLRLSCLACSTSALSPSGLAFPFCPVEGWSQQDWLLCSCQLDQLLSTTPGRGRASFPARRHLGPDL